MGSETVGLSGWEVDGKKEQCREEKEGQKDKVEKVTFRASKWKNKQ